MNEVSERIVIFGSSGHARVIADIIEKDGRYSIAGCIDSFRNAGETAFGNYSILGAETDLPALIATYNIMGGIIAVGDNWDRKTVYEKILAYVPDFTFINAVHPTAVLAGDVRLGKGIAIMANAVINAASVIDDFAIINTAVCVDHDNVVKVFASLAPRVVTGGNVTIGEFAAVSIGATIKHKIIIAPHTVIGAGSLVLHDAESHSIYYGTPARKVRQRKEGERYL